MTAPPVSSGRLRETLKYDPATGVFTRIRCQRGIRAGTTAGGLDDKGYVRIAIDRRLYKAHRLAWLYTYGEWPAGQIDHIDGDRSNNRISNLRVATSQQNNANRRPVCGKAAPKGVFRIRGRRWRAVITVDGKKHSLGMFDTQEAASEAYMAAAVRAHGKFAHGSQPVTV